MAADYSRIHRLLKLLMLIQGSKGWTPKKLAEECGTTQRTIYRDMKMLEAAGVPYFYDEQEKCYSIRRDFFLPPVQLTLDESLALVALADHVGGQEQVPFTKAAAKAIAKVRGQLPVAIRTELEQIEKHIAIQLAASQPPEAAADVYDTVRYALAHKVALRCQYESASAHGADGDQVFVLKPYALYFSQRAWYVVGHHNGHGEVRCMKLNRFAAIKPTEQTYEIPRSFSLAKHLGNAWRMIRGAKTYPVELHFDRDFAETIADTQWHSTQQVIWNDDQSITFRCKVDGLEEILWWVLSMGPHCIVKGPEELARRVRELAAGILSRYPGQSSTQPNGRPQRLLAPAQG